MQNKETIFDEKLLSRISVNYRYMTKQKTDEIGEIGLDYRYSASELHRVSNGYLTYTSYKPISNINYNKIISSDEKLF